MNIQSKLIISSILVLVVVWLLRKVYNRRISSGQALFWITLFTGAEILTLFPCLVDWLSIIWGNLIPLSWITFAGIMVLIVYLLHQTVQMNQLHARIVSLARSVAFLEERIRRMEGQHDNDTKSGERIDDDLPDL